MVAIKTCKPDATHEEKTKFLEEAGSFRESSNPFPPFSGGRTGNPCKGRCNNSDIE